MGSAPGVSPTFSRELDRGRPEFGVQRGRSAAAPVARFYAAAYSPQSRSDSPEELRKRDADMPSEDFGPNLIFQQRMIS
jgi:hypothetical protein